MKILVAITFMLLAASCKNKDSKTEVVEIKLEDTVNEEAKVPPPPPPAKTAEVNEIKDKLQGKWQSVEDDKNVVEFKGDRKFEYYENEPPVESAFTLNKDTLETRDIPSGDKMQYQVDQLTGSRLDLIYLARGNTLSYKKIK